MDEGSAEKRALLGALDGARRHILEALDGLDDGALRRAVLPSGWTILGLVSHLTRDVERFWFQAVVAGEQAAVDEVLAGPSDAWHVAADVTSATVLERYRSDAARADEIIAASPLEAPPGWWPEDLFGLWRIETVRGIVLHVITETATHAGQLDAARELIDGKLHVVLTD